MAKSALSSDTLPKAGRVNEVCREWLVHEDGALAYRLQDKEIKEHYMSNKVRNAQVREDLPRARVEQELEAIRYQSYMQQHCPALREEQDALVAKQIAMSLDREERLKERELQEQMRLQLRLDDEAAQLEIQRRIQEEKDEELARKLQKEEESTIDTTDNPADEQLMLDQKIAMEAQDAELARMLQDKERIKAKKAKEKARQRKLERQQLQQLEEGLLNPAERLQKPEKLDLKNVQNKSKARQSVNYPQYPDPEEIQILEESIEPVREVQNIAAVIDPTYNANRVANNCNTANTSYTLPSTTQDLIDDAPCYMPIQGQRRNQMQSPTQSHEEKNKRRVKDGCKHQ